MNILVIGNGFDLAHELPTKYTDFLEFVKVIKQALRKEGLAGINWGNIDAEVEKFLRFNKRKGQQNFTSKKQIWEDLINDNIWIEYFLPIYTDRERNGKDGWIDFESEISSVIQSLDEDIITFDFENNTQLISNVFLSARYCDANPQITYKQLRDKLLSDLGRLIRAFEIYLCEYVRNIEIQKKSPDIEKLEIDKVLSFNYTDTFFKLYKTATGTKEDKDSFDYIHGKAAISSTIESNNIVLGIDEYLPDDRKNKDVEFIAFKKYYQRIHKQTGCKYKGWVDNIRKDYIDHLHKIEIANYKELQYIPDKMQSMFNKHAMSAIKREKCQVHNLYIFGHSLDVTDGDILRDLILNDNVYTTIFYHNKDVMGQQIANLVKVIGQDELIRRTGGNTKTIEFKQQQDMVEINS